MQQYAGSTRRSARRAASTAGYARSQGRRKHNPNEADREVQDVRCKMATCKCQELHAKTPSWAGQIAISSFVLRTQRAAYIHVQPSLLALVVALSSARNWFALRAELLALCCIVLAVDARRQHARTYVRVLRV